MQFDRRLIFPTILLLCNIGSGVACLMGGDWKRGLYWMASAVCIACVTW